jgi:NADP-dependent 3-hydroxy acid dehydrogenase YdfG
MTSKTILISGCSKGIGRATADLFAKNGYHVAGCSRNKEELESMQQIYSSQYPHQRFFFAVADLTDAAQTQKFVSDFHRHFSHADILLNNTGTFIPGELLTEKNDTFDFLLKTNLYSAYYLSKACMPRMQASAKRCHVLTICSVASIKAYEHGGSYAVSKFALLGLTKQLREELKNTLIAVSAILPGATRTASWDGTTHPDSRFIQPEDIAKTILNAVSLSDGAVIEEILIRPQLGDL